MRRVVAALAGAALVGSLGIGLSAPAQAADVPPVPDDFHWGVATSGFQAEGYAPPSNWSRYAEQHEPYLNSVDFLHRYKEDIANAASLGVDTFRFGIEWARVEPQPGVFDPEGFAFYDDVIAEIKSHGMTPMITLSHWVHPAWFADQNGWANGKAVDRFVDYATEVVTRYAGKGAVWITFNEPVIYLQRELTNSSNPLLSLPLLTKLVQAHNRTYDVIHELDPGAMVSSNVAYIPGVEPVLDLIFLNRMKLDFLGLDYYYGASLDNPTALNAFLDKFWEVRPAPEGLYYALTYYHRRFPDLPVWIVENGIATDNGKPRPNDYTRSDHLRDHLYWMQRAIGAGVDVIGYNYWSITDNYEWGSYRPRFGLWTVDVVDDPALTRKPTDAVATYTGIIDSGGVAGDYEPELKPGLCNIDSIVDSCLRRLLGHK